MSVPRVNVFITHASEDDTHCQALAEHLTVHGHYAVFHDGELRAGQLWPVVLDSAVKWADLLVFLVSKHSAGSDWCGRELDLAKVTGRRVGTVFVRSLKLPEDHPLAQIHGLNSPRDPIHSGRSKLTDDEKWAEVVTEIENLRLVGRASPKTLADNLLAHLIVETCFPFEASASGAVVERQNTEREEFAYAVRESIHRATLRTDLDRHLKRIGRHHRNQHLETRIKALVPDFFEEPRSDGSTLSDAATHRFSEITRDFLDSLPSVDEEIPRAAARAVLVHANAGRPTVLRGSAGTGKSFVVRQLVREWSTTGRPVLAVRLDRVRGEAADDLGPALALPIDLLSAVDEVATPNAPLLLVLDQLDALHPDHGERAAWWPAVKSLLTGAIVRPHVRLVVVSRAGDKLSPVSDLLKSAAQEDVRSFNHGELSALLNQRGIKAPEPSSAAATLLCVPLFAHMVSHVDAEDLAGRPLTRGLIIDAFVEKRLQKLSHMRRSSARRGLSDLAKHLAAAETQALGVAATGLSDAVVDDLTKVQLVLHADDRLSFTHQTIMEHCWVRAEVTNTDRPLRDWLTELRETRDHAITLTRLVQGALLDRRDTGHPDYLEDLTWVLTSPTAREHIRIAAARVLGQAASPSAEEREVVRRLLVDEAPHVRELGMSVVRSSAEWTTWFVDAKLAFDLLTQDVTRDQAAFAFKLKETTPVEALADVLAQVTASDHPGAPAGYRALFWNHWALSYNPRVVDGMIAGLTRGWWDDEQGTQAVLLLDTNVKPMLAAGTADPAQVERWIAATTTNAWTTLWTPNMARHNLQALALHCDPSDDRGPEEVPEAVLSWMPGLLLPPRQSPLSGPSACRVDPFTSHPNTLDWLFQRMVRAIQRAASKGHGQPELLLDTLDINDSVHRMVGAFTWDALVQRSPGQAGRALTWLLQALEFDDYWTPSWIVMLARRIVGASENASQILHERLGSPDWGHGASWRLEAARLLINRLTGDDPEPDYGVPVRIEENQIRFDVPGLPPEGSPPSAWSSFFSSRGQQEEVPGESSFILERLAADARTAPAPFATWATSDLAPPEGVKATAWALVHVPNRDKSCDSILIRATRSVLTQVMSVPWEDLAHAAEVIGQVAYADWSDEEIATLCELVRTTLARPASNRPSTPPTSAVVEANPSGVMLRTNSPEHVTGLIVRALGWVLHHHAQHQHAIGSLIDDVLAARVPHLALETMASARGLLYRKQTTDLPIRWLSEAIQISEKTLGHRDFNDCLHYFRRPLWPWMRGVLDQMQKAEDPMVQNRGAVLAFHAWLDAGGPLEGSPSLVEHAMATQELRKGAATAIAHNHELGTLPQHRDQWLAWFRDLLDDDSADVVNTVRWGWHRDPHLNDDAEVALLEVLLASRGGIAATDRIAEAIARHAVHQGRLLQIWTDNVIGRGARDSLWHYHPLRGALTREIASAAGANRTAWLDRLDELHRAFSGAVVHLFEEPSG